MTGKQWGGVRTSGGQVGDDVMWSFIISTEAGGGEEVEERRQGDGPGVTTCLVSDEHIINYINYNTS